MSQMKRVLYVEDDDDIRAVVSEIIQEEGFLVQEARNGDQGLLALKESHQLPDVILLDLKMPIKDGIGFREEQIQDPRWARIPVILMSADQDLATKTKPLNFARHLRKPLDLDTLVSTLKGILA